MAANKIDEESDDFSYRIEWPDFHPITKTIIILLSAVILAGIIIKPQISDIFTLAGIVIGFFVAGPACQDIAHENNRSIQFAAAFGVLLGLLGWFLYWAYVKIVGKKEAE